MKATFFFSLLFLLPLAASAQLQDDFSDGNFTENPEWFGDTGVFTVTNGQLRLNNLAPAANNTSSLYLPAPTSTEELTTWECFVQLDFSPSSTNFARVYLMASQPDFNAPLDGYFLRIGGITGNEDAIDLFRQDGAATTLLFSGTTGAVGTPTVAVRVRMTRSTEGLWTLWADYTGGTEYQEEGSITDTTHALGQFFGFYCRYTSTRGTAFGFDDVFINPLFTDTTPPLLLGASAPDANTVVLDFNEPLQAAAAQNTTNYAISNAIGTPLSAVLDAQNPTRVTLQTAQPLANSTNYMVTASNIADVAGNAAAPQVAAFTFLAIGELLPGDLIITEIMADPTPQVGLPDAEYVELYNNSSKVLQLEGASFVAGTTARAMPAYLLLPGAYVTLCSQGLLPEFAALGPALGLSSLPALTNAGARLSLTAPGGGLLHEVTYSDAWYQDPIKKDGGWSLELVRLAGPYDCAGNWRASVAPAGGTPGRANSIAGSEVDAVPPQALAVFTEGDMELVLVFDETLDVPAASDVALYSLSPAISISSAMVLDAGRRQVTLFLDAPLQPATVYTLTVSSGIRDCLGNEMTASTELIFGLPEPMSPGDIVINELLYHPQVGGDDFIEFYNRSSKVIDLIGCRLVNETSTTSSRQTTVSVNSQVLPGGYLVLAIDPDDILSRYDVPNPGQMKKNSLPTLSPKSGNITLYSPEAVMIDSFNFSDDLHYALLDSERGISLERLSPDGPTNSPGNWHSAATTIGGATPTYQNSQFLADNTTTGPDIITLPNKTFSPDGDGFEDLLSILYETPAAGFTANISVFDAHGRLVQRIARSELLARTGSFKWDGTTNEGQRARIGIYVLWGEFFSPDGTVKREKKAIVVAGQLD